MKSEVWKKERKSQLAVIDWLRWFQWEKNKHENKRIKKLFLSVYPGINEKLRQNKKKHN